MRIDINGGVIKYAEYKKDNPSIMIHYQDGRSKSFHDIPESIALGLKNAEDKEDFYTKNIQPFDPEYRTWKDKK